jgi:hypothetical protein
MHVVKKKYLNIEHIDLQFILDAKVRFRGINIPGHRIDSNCNFIDEYTDPSKLFGIGQIKKPF